jgi:hypothetical protein
MNEAGTGLCKHTESISAPAGLGAEQTLCPITAGGYVARQEIELAFERDVLIQVECDTAAHTRIRSIEFCKPQRCEMQAYFDLRFLRLRQRGLFIDNEDGG